MVTLLLRPRGQAAASARLAAVGSALTDRARSDRDSALTECATVAVPSGEFSGDPGAVLLCRFTIPLEAVGLLLTLVRSGDWDGVMTLGPGARQSLAELAGAAPVGAAWRRAARATGRCAVVRLVAAPRGGAEARPPVPLEDLTARIGVAESSLQLLGALERRRSEPQQEAGRRIEAGDSQREAATALGITQQAVHDRLRHGLWQETRSLAGAVAELLGEIDTNDG